MSSQTPGTKKMYSYRHGIVELFAEGITLNVYRSKDGQTSEYKKDNKFDRYDKYPSLISLEQAEKQGLVSKKNRKNAKSRIKYELIDENKLCISTYGYETFDEMHEIYNNDDNIRFISFVDDRLNECPPPEEIVEWEEIGWVQI